MTHSALYRGELVHARDDQHARRTFRYGVFMASLDLDELPERTARACRGRTMTHPASNRTATPGRVEAAR